MGRGCDEADIGEEKRLFTEWGRHSVNEGFGKEFYRKGNSVKRFRPVSESLQTLNIEIFCAHPLPKSPLLIAPSPRDGCKKEEVEEVQSHELHHHVSPHP